MKKSFDKIYKNVPLDQKEQFRQFRSAHPYKECVTDGITWEYILCGKGEALVLLPGGIRSAETWFKLITVLENEYQIVSPTYPALPTMAEHTKGIAAILESETIEKAHILGTSFGGWVAQCFVRSHPEKVATLILSNTSGPHWISSSLLRIGQASTFLFPQFLIQSAFRRNLFNLLSVSDSDQEFWKAFVKEVSLKMTRNDLTAQQKCGLDFNNYVFTKEDLIDWPGRILILESDDDTAIKYVAREKLKALYPQAQVHTFHKAGHTPGYTNPKEYISVIKNFLHLNRKSPT